VLMHSSLDRPCSYIILFLHCLHDLSNLDRPYLYTIYTGPHDIYPVQLSHPRHLAFKMSRTTFEPFLTPSLLENSSPARDSHQAISSGVSIGCAVLPTPEVEGASVLGIGFEVFVLICEEVEGRRGNAPNEVD
jgi:hypothetical protein